MLGFQQGVALNFVPTSLIPPAHPTLINYLFLALRAMQRSLFLTEVSVCVSALQEVRVL
jgi:hypothetical protein